MTSRERWTVYPLLFLAIGLALRANVLPPEQVGDLDITRLTCRELVVVDDRGNPFVRTGRDSADGGGRIELFDSGRRLAVVIGAGAVAEDASIRFFDSQEREVDRLAPAGALLPPPGPSPRRR